MDPYHNRPAVEVVPAHRVGEIQDLMHRARGMYEDEEQEYKPEYTSLATYIQQIYQDNKDIRSSSGIEDKMLQSLRAYNGHYDPEDLSRIKAAGGSEIYMNLTPTKCRAAMSWLRDIMMPAKENAWGLYPTDVPELPEEIRAAIEEQINSLVESPQTQEMQQQGMPQKATAMSAAQKVTEINQLKRDIEDAIADEIYRVAMGETKKYEKIIADQLQEGSWEKAFSDFIEDFCVFPVAVMKAPIITKKKRLTYVNGTVEEKEDFIFLNKRVSPLDIYPSADATDITDGNLCEHLRFDRKTLYNLIGVPNYKEEAIRKVLENCEYGFTGGELDSTVESDKIIEEYRGDTFRASKGIIHGVHFHGSIPWRYLNEWGFEEDKIGTDEDKEFEVEAILAGGEVIKCVLNSDPLLRRPYYKASWQNIPGSWWGRSLPELMRDIQRMCNATARALANNMAVASGPQIEIYVDRLADDSEVDAIEPFHVWQLTSDPSGAGGRAITFWQPTSNAQELLAVYKEFEIRADDATGIPRYAYGNERSLADYEKVVTPFGHVEIGKLEVGMEVCNTYGGISLIEGVYPQGICDIFRVKFSNNTHIDCTMDHLWNVATNDKFSTKSLEELLEEGIYRKDGDKYIPKFKIPNIASVTYINWYVPVDPYTMGVWLGDGSKGTGIITNTDREVLDNIPYKITTRSDGIHHNCLGLITDLKLTDVWDKGCFDKFIPMHYLYNSEHIRLEVLRGLMDTDGCCTENGRLIYTTSSKRLRDDFIQLVRSLGGTTQGYSINRKPGYKPSYKITFQYNNLSIPLFKIKRKESRRVSKTRYVNTYIVGVEYVGSHTATCIKVNSADRLYVCGNFIPTHNTGAAAQTASGLSMLLESAAKGIKDSVRNIDFGVIKPRIEYQFYWNVISNDSIKFTGDVNVVPKGSEILTMKGASEMRRNEFLNILSNPNYMQIVGIEGIADILREMAKSLGLGTNIIPSRIELKKKQEEMQQQQAQAQQQQSETEMAKVQSGLQATQMQIQGQMQMHQQTQELKAQEIAAKLDQQEKDRQMKAIEMQMEAEAKVHKETAALQKQQMIEENKSYNTDKQIALSIQTGDKMNTQTA